MWRARCVERSAHADNSSVLKFFWQAFVSRRVELTTERSDLIPQRPPPNHSRPESASSCNCARKTRSIFVQVAWEVLGEEQEMEDYMEEYIVGYMFFFGGRLKSL